MRRERPAPPRVLRPERAGGAFLRPVAPRSGRGDLRVGRAFHRPAGSYAVASASSVELEPIWSARDTLARAERAGNVATKGADACEEGRPQERACGPEHVARCRRARALRAPLHDVCLHADGRQRPTVQSAHGERHAGPCSRVAVLRGEAFELDEDVARIDEQHALRMHDERDEHVLDCRRRCGQRQTDPGSQSASWKNASSTRRASAAVRAERSRSRRRPRGRSSTGGRVRACPATAAGARGRTDAAGPPTRHRHIRRQPLRLRLRRADGEASLVPRDRRRRGTRPSLSTASRAPVFRVPATPRGCAWRTRRTRGSSSPGKPVGASSVDPSSTTITSMSTCSWRSAALSAFEARSCQRSLVETTTVTLDPDSTRLG